MYKTIEVSQAESSLNQSIANLAAAKERYGNIQVRELLIETAFSGLPLSCLCGGLQAAFPELKTGLYHRLLSLSRRDLDDLIAQAFDDITIIDDANNNRN